MTELRDKSAEGRRGDTTPHTYTPSHHVQASQWFQQGDHAKVEAVPEGNYGDVPGPWQAEQCGWVWAVEPGRQLPGGGAGPAGFVVTPGSYVVGPEPNGAYWPCDKATFEEKYEKVTVAGPKEGKQADDEEKAQRDAEAAAKAQRDAQKRPEPSHR